MTTTSISSFEIDSDNNYFVINDDGEISITEEGVTALVQGDINITLIIRAIDETGNWSEPAVIFVKIYSFRPTATPINVPLTSPLSEAVEPNQFVLDTIADFTALRSNLNDLGNVPVGNQFIGADINAFVLKAVNSFAPELKELRLESNSKDAALDRSDVILGTSIGEPSTDWQPIEFKVLPDQSNSEELNWQDEYDPNSVNENAESSSDTTEDEGPKDTEALTMRSFQNQLDEAYTVMASSLEISAMIDDVSLDDAFFQQLTSTSEAETAS